MFTANLHLLGILLACQQLGTLPRLRGIQATDVRTSLDFGLETLQAVKRTSLMSQKAGNCLKGFLRAYDSLSTLILHLLLNKYLRLSYGLI